MEREKRFGSDVSIDVPRQAPGNRTTEKEGMFPQPFTGDDARVIGEGIKEASFVNPHKGEEEED
jgi:hypothetical protein